MTQPASVPADGSMKVTWVPTIADPTAPTVAELNAITAVDASCALTAEGFTPGTDEQTITDDRLCSRQTFEQPGRFTDTLELSYVHNPASAADNALYLALPRGTVGFVVVRWGVDYEGVYAAGDIVDVIPVKAGVQRKNPGAANSVLTVSQKMFVTGEVQRDVVVVA